MSNAERPNLINCISACLSYQILTPHVYRLINSGVCLSNVYKYSHLTGFKTMADPSPSPQSMQEATTSTVTVVESVDDQDHEVPTLKLRLKKPKNDKKVKWTTETVDNEHMNKKKSKCCCIYEKPKKFDESSSDEESDEECEHCKGHVEKKKKNPTQDPVNCES